MPLRGLNCDELPGRLRDICRGHTDDGTPLSMSEAKRQAYIARWKERHAPLRHGFPPSKGAGASGPGGAGDCSTGASVDPSPHPSARPGSTMPDSVPDRPAHTKPHEPPSLRRQVWNLAASLAAFVADGLRTVDKEEYRQRLEICDRCNRRRGNRCLKCGCRFSLKARGRAFKCPLGKWPEG